MVMFHTVCSDRQAPRLEGRLRDRQARAGRPVVAAHVVEPRHNGTARLPQDVEFAGRLHGLAASEDGVGDVLAQDLPLRDQQAVADEDVDHRLALGCQRVKLAPRNLDGHEPDPPGGIQLRRELVWRAVVVGIRQGIVCSSLASISNS